MTPVPSNKQDVCLIHIAPQADCYFNAKWFSLPVMSALRNRRVEPGRHDLGPVLMAEASHRIANHLSLLCATLRLEADAVRQGPELVERAAVVERLRAAVSRIEAIGQLHRTLAEVPRGSVELSSFLCAKQAEIVRSLGLAARLQVHTEFHGTCRINAEHAGCLALVLGEIIANAAKYARPDGDQVTIVLGGARTGDGRIVLVIADNGVGLPENFDETRDGGTGLRLVRSLCKSIGASLELSGPGLIHRLVLPAAP